ncbi:hypothetical protein M407DRAFT_243023 [Tulasnella calospora MUT 4182]|uniref:Uncharacterized protein n=1 Tax=Tulasnella calospora MUT 4182 TaxID=1051891 RepID=A0A0C3QCD2_9AGAM|nr:hypothetical protein M407DRAFT_243023 [Tulasnella calospora MUT 4182]
MRDKVSAGDGRSWFVIGLTRQQANKSRSLFQRRASTRHTSNQKDGSGTKTQRRLQK